MSERKFKPSGKGVAKLIFQYLQEIYPDLEFSYDDICELVVPSEQPGSDVKFLGIDFAERYKVELESLMRDLYLKLTAENDKGWYERTFYGMLKGTNIIRFRLVDDSTT